MMGEIPYYESDKGNEKYKDNHGHADFPEQQVQISHIRILNDNYNKKQCQDHDRRYSRFHIKSFIYWMQIIQIAVPADSSGSVSADSNAILVPSGDIDGAPSYPE